MRFVSKISLLKFQTFGHLLPKLPVISVRNVGLSPFLGSLFNKYL